MLYFDCASKQSLRVSRMEEHRHMYSEKEIWRWITIFFPQVNIFFTHVNHISPMYKGLQNWYTNEQSLV